MGQAHGALGTPGRQVAAGGCPRARWPRPLQPSPPRSVATGLAASPRRGAAAGIWGQAGLRRGCWWWLSARGGCPGGSPLGSRTCRTVCRSRTASGRVAARTGRGGERGAAPEGPPSRSTKGQNSSGAARRPPQNLPKFHSSTPQGEVGWPGPSPVPTGATREPQTVHRGGGLSSHRGWGDEGGSLCALGSCSSPKPNPGDRSQGGERAAAGLPARL